MTSEKELEALFNDVLMNISKISAVPEFKVAQFRQTGKHVLKGTLPTTDAVVFEKAETEFVRKAYEDLHFDKDRWEDAIRQADESISLAKSKYGSDAGILRQLMLLKKNHEINSRFYSDLHGKFVDFYMIMVLRNLHLKKQLSERPLYPINDLNAYALAVPEEVPAHIKNDLDAARKCLAYNLRTPALVMCRRALETALVEKYKSSEKKEPKKNGNSAVLQDLYKWAVENDFVRSKYGNFVADLNEVGTNPKEMEIDEKTSLNQLNGTITLVIDLYK